MQIFERFLKDGVIEKLKTVPEPFRVEKIDSIGLNQRVVVSAKHKGEVMGYIWIQELDRNLTDEELDFYMKLHSMSEKSSIKRTG